ncbi:hypothetical protein Aduo_007385 [Ancylostoma duodenale]
MDSTTISAEIPEISLETLVPLLVLLAIILYCLIVAVVFIFLCTRCPHRLKQSPSHGVVPEIVSFMDCTLLLQCLPCTECSPRKALRACCPNTESIRRIASCDWIQRQPQGPRAGGVDLVCCVVCES